MARRNRGGRRVDAELAGRAWRIQQAAGSFGVGLVELMQLADTLNAAQRSHLAWALYNSLQQLLPGCELQAVLPPGRKPVRLADFILRQGAAPPPLAGLNGGRR